MLFLVPITLFSSLNIHLVYVEKTVIERTSVVEARRLQRLVLTVFNIFIFIRFQGGSALEKIMLYVFLLFLTFQTI